MKTEKKPSKKAKKEEEAPVDTEEIVEDIDAVAEEILFGKNPSRAYALRDVWFESLSDVVSQQAVPEQNRNEVFFLTLSNALLDMIMDVVPEDQAMGLARNLDDFLAVTLVNKKYDVDLLQTFQKEFVDAMGSNFEDEEKLMDALSKFEDKWWNTPRKDLEGKTANQVLEEAAEQYDL